MIKKFPTPYIVFYPVFSRDGMPFPVNKCIREIQNQMYDETRAWRGNLVVAKYRDADYSVMIDASMADFPIIKNYLSTHPAPSYRYVRGPHVITIVSFNLTHFLCLDADPIGRHGLLGAPWQHSLNGQHFLVCRLEYLCERSL